MEFSKQLLLEHINAKLAMGLKSCNDAISLVLFFTIRKKEIENSRIFISKNLKFERFEPMNRKDFLKVCGILGLQLPLQGMLSSCEAKLVPSKFNGRVIIIGAGAGGLTAAYLLHQQGIAFEVLEASSSFGGRMKVNKEFADFPIPLGAEWLETGRAIFQEIVNDSSVKVEIETIADDSNLKFVNSSWLSFFEEYVVPSITKQIKFNTIAQSIDFNADEIIVKASNGEFKADKLLIALPLKILQDGDVVFSPNLPKEKEEAIQKAKIWSGFKAFFEFKENFYGEGYEFKINPKSDGQKVFYDASFGQNSKKNILGLLSLGKPADDLTKLTNEELKFKVLKELDSLYENKASLNYIKHISQNWNEEPFIKAGYLSDHEDWRLVRDLGKSVANKLFFAGGAYTDGSDWVSVHTAAQSAKMAVTELLR